jgi:hypothetical protein
LARAATTAAVLLACLVLVPLAHADGDPASDFLLTQAVFVPPDVVIPQDDAQRLTATVADAKSKGVQIRVAVIGTRYDMGSVGALFRKPQQYALFLGQELRFVYKGRLLVVMPNGYGASRGGKRWPAAEAVVRRLAAPGASGPALAAAAQDAVTKVAGAGGVVVAAPSTAGPSSHTARTAVVIALLALGAVAVAVILLRPGRRDGV